LSHKKNPCEIDIKKQPITLKTPKRLAANKKYRNKRQMAVIPLVKITPTL